MYLEFHAADESIDPSARKRRGPQDGNMNRTAVSSGCPVVPGSVAGLLTTQSGPPCRKMRDRGRATERTASDFVLWVPG